MNENKIESPFIRASRSVCRAIRNNPFTSIFVATSLAAFAGPAPTVGCLFFTSAAAFIDDFGSARGSSLPKLILCMSASLAALGLTTFIQNNADFALKNATVATLERVLETGRTTTHSTPFNPFITSWTDKTSAYVVESREICRNKDNTFAVLSSRLAVPHWFADNTARLDSFSRPNNASSTPWKKIDTANTTLRCE